MDRPQSHPHSCHHCQSLILDPQVAYEPAAPDFESRICRCSQCQKWVRAMGTSHQNASEGSFFFILDSQSMLKAREDGCATARELFDTWDEVDEQSIEYLRERGTPFEMTDIVVSCGYRKPNKHDICRLQVRGPHLIFVDGNPPEGDYGVCIEDEYGVAASRDDPSSRYITGRETHRETDHPEAYHMAARWVKECIQSHPACQSPFLIPNTFIPTRLLRVNNPDLGFDYVKMVSAEHIELSARYIALSYCWGGDQLGKTVEANISSRSRNLRVSDQPKTIRDAIKVTRRLHFDYLWIDSLCIIQDDPEDMARELACMDKVYEYADLLISATSAKSSAEGMLNPVLNLPANVSCGYRCPDGQVGRILLQKAGYTPGALGVHGRCWTLQEHLLPSRILAYAGSGLRWSCRTTTLFDGPWTTSTVFINYLENIETYRRMSAILSSDVPCGVPTVIHNQITDLNVDGILIAELLQGRQKPRPGARAVSPHEPDTTQGAGSEVTKPSAIAQWRKLLREFTSRSITNSADRLPAISAAARKFNNVLQGRYIAGLWEVALPLELLWAPQGGSNKGRDQEGPFPSWSWASTRHRVEWHVPSAGVATLHCLRTQLDFLYPSVPYGHVTKGWLRVRGDLMPVKCEAVDAPIDPSEWQIEQGLPMVVRNSAFLVPRFACNDAAYEEVSGLKILAILDEKTDIEALQEIYCLEVIREDLATSLTASRPSVGLVLAPIDESGSAFGRIGLFGMLHGRITGLRTREAVHSKLGDKGLDMFWEEREVLLM
ncbi:heterokaryon incompatibility protein-domain-containing protein [Nemania abortiva]|nr:heterokaryon incompatibility protein-domain-containing protein [Nemania abortiva]